MKSILRNGLSLAMVLAVTISSAFAAGQFPAFEQLRLPKPDSTQKPYVMQSSVMAVKNGYTFILNEINCYIVADTLVDGVPAEQAKFRLKSGTRVKVTGYRYGSANLVVDELTILK